MNSILKKAFLLGLCLWSSSCMNRTASEEYKFTGTLELTEHGVGVPVSGRIATLTVDEGDEVKTGQLIATTDHYNQKSRDYKRLSQLLTQGGANQQQVEQAELDMLDERVVSPVNGVVLTKVHDTGEVVSAQAPIVIIGDRNRLWVKVYVPEGLVNRVKMDMPAKLHFDGLSSSYKGHVTYISPQGEFTPRNVQTPEERVTQTFAVKVSLDDAPASLRPGVASDVTLPLGEEKN